MLTGKVARFVEHYTGDCEGNGAKSAEMSGYAKGAAAKVQAVRLLKRPDVQAAIVARREQIANRPLTAAQRGKIADAAERRELLSRIARRGGKNPMAAIKAADVLNKMDGVYVTKLADPNGKPLIPTAVTFNIRKADGADCRP